MKKLLMGVFGLGLMLSVVSVQAETIDSVANDSNSVDNQVVVGDVATPNYMVDIYWEDLSFDWVYNYETNNFDWEPSKVCSEIFDSSENIEQYILSGDMDVYTNDSCTELASEYDSGINEYYYLEERTFVPIYISDFSENGQIVPSVEWQSETKYSYVNGKFRYIGFSCVAVDEEVFEEVYEYGYYDDMYVYSDSNCTERIQVDSTTSYEEGMYSVAIVENELLTSSLPANARIPGMGGPGFDFDSNYLSNGYTGRGGMYDLSLNLENDPDKEVVTPTAGDTIGAITITINAK